MKISRKDLEKLTGEKTKVKAPRRVKGVMNKTEAKFVEDFLEPRKLAGEIFAYWFEQETLPLAPRTTYTPDFEASLADGSVVFYEIKGGYTWDDSMVKLKVAAVMYPLAKFYLCKYIKKQWKIRLIPSSSKEK